MRVNVVTEAFADSAGSSGPLHRVRLRDPLRLQRGDVGHRIEARSFDLAGVDDVDDVADGDGRLADVRRQDDLAASESWFIESGALLGHVDQRVQEVDVGVVADDDVVGTRLQSLRGNEWVICFFL